MRRLAAMSVHAIPPECSQQASSTGLGEILPPALQASLKVGRSHGLPALTSFCKTHTDSAFDGILGVSEVSAVHGWKGTC